MLGRDSRTSAADLGGCVVWILDVLIPVAVCGYSVWCVVGAHREVEAMLALLEDMQREDPQLYVRWRERLSAIYDHDRRSGRSR